MKISRENSKPAGGIKKTSMMLLLGVVILSFITHVSNLHAQVPRAKAWVWANQPTTGSYIPSSYYQYNSTGGTNRVTRLGVGQYKVEFPGLGTGGGMVHVTSYRGNHQSKVVSWVPSGSTLHVSVRCYRPTGSPVDGMFTVLFYKENRSTYWTDAYLWANRPTASSYTPNTLYQWNSKGSTNTVRRLARGCYQVRLPGMNLLGGTVLVTAYGTGSQRGKVERWVRSGNDTLVNVLCFDAGGNFTDTLFTLSFLKDVGLGIRYSEDQHYGGFVWANQPTAASYTPSSTYQYNNTSKTITIRRLNVGSYRVHFPLLASSNRTTALVTAYGSGSDYCTIDRWGSDGARGTYVFVKCFNRQGNPVDTRFTLLYLTDDQVLY